MITKLRQTLSKYSWPSEYRIVEVPNWGFQVYFDKCRLDLYENMRYNAVECEVYNQDQTKSYGLNTVLEFNNKDFKDMYTNLDNVSKGDYLEQIVTTLHDCLYNVIEGDFSWVRRADERYYKTRQIQKAFGTPFVFDSLAYKKLVEGDSTWEDNLPK